MAATWQAAQGIRRRQGFVADYIEMRSWGLTHRQIAERLGVARESLIRRCDRNGIYIPEPEERHVYDALDRLIESGRPFVSSDLPMAQAGIGTGALTRAFSDGRIRAVGWATLNDIKGHRRRLWQSTAVVTAVVS